MTMSTALRIKSPAESQNGNVLKASKIKVLPRAANSENFIADMSSTQYFSADNFAKLSVAAASSIGKHCYDELIDDIAEIDFPGDHDSYL
jgi:hypothetical protein